MVHQSIKATPQSTTVQTERQLVCIRSVHMGPKHKLDDHSACSVIKSSAECGFVSINRLYIIDSEKLDSEHPSMLPLLVWWNTMHVLLGQGRISTITKNTFHSRVV